MACGSHSIKMRQILLNCRKFDVSIEGSRFAVCSAECGRVANARHVPSVFDSASASANQRWEVQSPYLTPHLTRAANRSLLEIPLLTHFRQHLWPRAFWMMADKSNPTFSAFLGPYWDFGKKNANIAASCVDGDMHFNSNSTLLKERHPECHRGLVPK